MHSIIGHEGVLRELQALALSPEPAHAILLAGPHSTGRSLLAREYARLLNCEAADGLRPCGSCRPCRLIAEGAHPDVLALSPGDTLCKPRHDEAHDRHPQSRDIRICQVRGLIELVARYPFEARTRVVIIEPADGFALAAAQAMLKTLEEPPPHTALVLIASGPESMLETMLSRCRRVDVRVVPRSAIEEGLLARGYPPELASRAAHDAHGRPGRALAFAAQPDLMGDFDRLLERCASLVAASASERFTHAAEMTERYRRDRALLAPELDAWDAFWERQLRLAAEGTGVFPARQALESLQAVERAREDLQAQVMTRPALELMLLTFPRATMDGTASPAPDEERSVPHVS